MLDTHKGQGTDLASQGTQLHPSSLLQDRGHLSSRVPKPGCRGKEYLGSPQGPPAQVGTTTQPNLPGPHPTPNMASACSPMRSRFMLAAAGDKRGR